MEDLSDSYLFAIQKISGETQTDKFKEIGRIVQHIVNFAKNQSDIKNAIATVPNALVPLIKVLVGVKIKSPSLIIQALKSDDIYLITEALRARWFYDGSDKSITNYKYFSEAIFPYVSMFTRRNIVKKLSVCLLENEPCIAEDFFNGIVDTYGVQEATILLPACRSDFIYKAVVKHKINLSNKILKNLYRKYPNLVLRYLRFANPYGRRDETDRIMFKIVDINEYENFMPLLITKHPETFIDMQEISRISPNLGNRRTKMLLKHAKKFLIERPREVIDLMPIKLVYDNLTQEEFETMFGNIMEDRWDMFNIDNMLNYLEYYPEDKRATLIKNKVKEKYGFNILEKVEKMTTKFLLLLPQKERFDLARRIIEVGHKVVDGFDSENTWWCYLPIDEAISALKIQMAKNWRSNKRQKIFSQLIYVCKLNESKDALLEVLKFLDEKCKNERSQVICSMLDRITQEFDLDTFDNQYWPILFNLVKRIKLKKENARDYWVLIKILKKNVHYCIKHDLPYDDIIQVIVRLFVEGRVGVSWKLLEDEAEYERKYLDVCFKHNYWLNMDYKKNIVEGIYNFNERHGFTNESTGRLSLKDYPHLLEIVKRTIKDEQNETLSWIIYTKEKLEKHEPELFKSWFCDKQKSEKNEKMETDKDEKQIELAVTEKIRSEKTIEKMDEETEDESEEKRDVVKSDNTDGDSSIDSVKSSSEVKEKVIYLTEAIIALKRNFSVIKENWPQYYECCKNEVNTKKRRRVKLFLKTLRWYQEIPIKFVERSIEENNFHIIGYLVDGPTFFKIAQKQLPDESNKDNNAIYLNAIQITSAVKNTTTPIPIYLVEKYLTASYMYSFKNYINDGLKLWSYVAYRTSSEKMIKLSKNLAANRLFLKRHAIRVMNIMAARSDLVEFFKEMWVVVKHPLIRQMLADRVGTLFSKRPSADSWELMSTCIDDLSIHEDNIFEDLMGFKSVPLEFAAGYAEKTFNKLQEFISKGMSTRDALDLLDRFFQNFKPDCTDQLSNDFYKEVLAFYLINFDAETPNIDRFIVKVYLNPASIHLQERLVHLSICFTNESKRWYGLSIEKRKLSTNFVDRIIQVVVFQVLKFKGNLSLVENLYRMVSTILIPYKHSWSYIMLFLCTEFMRTQPSFKDFGIRISETISSLVEKFSPEYFMHIVELIREFICNFNFYEYSATIKNRLNFLEGLIENENKNGPIIAAKLLNLKIVSEYDNQHCQILRILSEIDNPLVQSLL
ncbi:uncharacterized protein LOC131673097 [Phymastichus coffea]|uniref:uncharacterized protein LOC131673097 n=1 Tax=Phymastichus coffea TaxID=108790 RepID=UPI00273AA8DD|nr:uncharacterized protein LOC131673097 [Phymastichus coffea]